jgi:hypothetical protein
MMDAVEQKPAVNLHQMPSQHGQSYAFWDETSRGVTRPQLTYRQAELDIPTPHKITASHLNTLKFDD